MSDTTDTKSLNAGGDAAPVEENVKKDEKKKGKVDEETQKEEKDGKVVKGKGKKEKGKEVQGTDQKEAVGKESKVKGKEVKKKESKAEAKFTGKEAHVTENKETEGKGKGKGKELKESKESKQELKAGKEHEQVKGHAEKEHEQVKGHAAEGKEKEAEEKEAKGKGKKETGKGETTKAAVPEPKPENKRPPKVKRDRGDQIELGFNYDEDAPHVTPSQIARQLAAIRARDRVEARSWYHQWPTVTKVPIRTKPWAPPGPREKPPRVIIQLPKIKTETWIPPWMQKRPPRPRLPRQTPDVTEPLPYETTKLNKVWHRFSRVDANKMILQGTIACDSKRYGLAVRACQTGSIALVARALLHEKTPAQLDKTDIDDVIEAADAHYKQCTKSLKCYKGAGNPELQLKQLLRELFFRDTYYKLDYGEEVQSGLLLKRPPDPEGRPSDRGVDLLDLMERQVGQNYMFILTLNQTKHFLIWGHPPEPDSGSLVETVCYILDPFMLDEVGTRNYTSHPAGACRSCCVGDKSGAAAFLRYAGVTSFVVDFLMNHGNLLKFGEPVKEPRPEVPITLTTVDVIKTRRVMRYPTYQQFDMVTRKHCQSEIDAVTAYAMTEEKLYQRMWAIASMSAESVNVTRKSSRKRLRKMLGLDGIEKPPPPPIVIEPPPVPPEKPPLQPTIQELLQAHKGEDFFLYCPRPDIHTFGRDDLIPLGKEELEIHSHYVIGGQTYKSQFSQVEPGKWILRGTRHFASYRYQSFKWFTGVACCIAALAMLKRHRARAWNEDVIDETFDAGYNLLRESLMERRGPIRRLVLGEHKRIFSIRDKQYKFKKRNVVVWGKLMSQVSKIFDLCRGLETFFREADTGILQIPGELETAIWYEGGYYYLYHPWPADEYGYKVGLQGGGKGCLIGFGSIEKLCEHFLENCKDLKRKPYTISDVTVWDLGQRPEPFNNMKAVGANRWILRGGFHEGDERFPEAHRNKQATPTAITAIAMASVIDPNEWTQADVNEVLIRGDTLYEKTMENLDKLGINLEQPARVANAEEEAANEEDDVGGAAGVTGTLAAADVLPRFNITTQDAIEVEMQDSAFSGELMAEKGSGVLSLKQSLKALFKDNNAGVVTARGASMAVWKHDDHLYFFDPHACDENGLPSDDILASACLIRMKNNVKELADVIMGNLEPGTDDSFNITPVEIIRNKINLELGAPEIQREGKAFEWLNRNTATILMGPRGENTGRGEAATKCSVPMDDLAGRTLALPVVAAFTAATEAVPPPGMHQEHMFNFLEAGGEYYINHVKTTGRREITVEDLNERFEMGVNTFSIEVGEPVTLPLRLPDPSAEGGGDEEEEAGVDSTLPPLGEGEEEKPKPIPLKQMKELLFRMWYDMTKPTSVSLLCGDYHQLGVWMAAGGKVIAFDPAPTLAKGLLTKHRIAKGDELRKQRLKEMMGEGAEEEEDEPAAGEEAQPEPEPEFVPPESCPVLMVFASPGEFIDKLVMKGGLTPTQALAPYSLFPVTVTNELTSMVKDKKPPVEAKADDEPAADEEEEGPTVEPLEDEALGKYFSRKTRTTASMRAHMAQDEPYFMDAPNRDNQDSAMAIMGIIVHHIEPYEYWKPSLVDAILKYGDRLYTLSLPNARHPPRVAPVEVIKEFHVTNFNVKTEVLPDVVTGDYKAGDTGNPLSLKRGLKKFFETEKFGVICAKNYCAGVWKAKDDKAWVYWDTHPVGPTGKLSPASAAGIVLFSTLDELAETFKTNLHNLSRPGTNNYTISSVSVHWEYADGPPPVPLQDTVPDAGYEWKVLTAYVELVSGRTILRGTQALDAEKFARDTQMWSAASAIVAASMANIRRPQTWTVKTVDEIIRNGCMLFTKSMQKLGYEFCPGEDALHPLQVDKKYVLGTNYIHYDLQEVAHGKLEAKTYQQMTAELGLDKFFRHNSCGILWSAPYAVAMWRVKGAPQYYMMEPHACGPNGMRVNIEFDAAACVMTFTTPKQMSLAYLQNLPRIERRRTDFDLYSLTMNVQPLKGLAAGDRDPPLVRPPPGAPKGHRVVPATLKFGPDGRRRDLVAGGAKRSELEIKDARDLAKVQKWNRDNQEDMDQGLRNSNGWLCLRDGTQYLSGPHSMTCKKFPYASRGNQALACSIMAVAVSALNEICHWDCKSICEILVSGNQLYQDSFLHYRPKETNTLNIKQILRKFYTPRNCACRVTVFQPRQHGLLEEDVDSLANNIRKFFREENKGVFVAHGGEFAVALFKNSRGFYMFDPADRDRYGRALPGFLTGHGRACFSQYPTVKALTEKLKENIPYRERKIPPLVATPATSATSGAVTPEIKPGEAGLDLTKPVGPDEKRKESTVHFQPGPDPDKDSVNGIGKYSIYGIEVTSLRKLLPYEK